MMSRCESCENMLFDHKRGDTFLYEFELDALDSDTPSLIGQTARAMMRTVDTGEVVHVFTCQITGPRTVSLFAHAADTASWPIGECVCDIELDDNGFVDSTADFYINIRKDVTYGQV